MAYQQTGGPLKTTAVDHTFLAPIKLKWTTALGALTILSGHEIVNTVSGTNNTNAAVATITLNCSLPDIEDVVADYRDDAQTGNYCTTGNIVGEATANVITFKVGYFLAAGTAMTAAQVNTNAVVVGISVIFRNTNVATGS